MGLPLTMGLPLSFATIGIVVKGLVAHVALA